MSSLKNPRSSLSDQLRTIAAFLGGSGVALGAYGAHGLVPKKFHPGPIGRRHVEGKLENRRRVSISSCRIDLNHFGDCRVSGADDSSIVVTNLTRGEFRRCDASGRTSHGGGYNLIFWIHLSTMSEHWSEIYLGTNYTYWWDAHYCRMGHDVDQS